MQLTIFDTDLNQVSILYTWISLVWLEEYNDTGSFQLELQRTPGLEEIIQPWRYCVMVGNNIPMVILSVEIDENRIIANGECATYILTRRISTNTIGDSGNAEETIRSVISNMTEWPKLELGDLAGLEDTYSAKITSDSAFNRIQKIANSADMGFRIVKEGQKLLFECYKPTNNPNIKYSDMYGNVSGITYTVNQRDFANVALVDGMASENGRISELVGDVESEGHRRLELYVDAKDLQIEQNESEQAYRNRLIARGEDKLSKSAHADALKFTPNNDEAKVGDIINIVIKSLNLRFAVRVMSVQIVHQRNTIKRSITVGDPMVTKTRRV